MLPARGTLVVLDWALQSLERTRRCTAVAWTPPVSPGLDLVSASLFRANLEPLLARNLYHWCFLMRRWPMTRKARTKSEETSHRCYRNPRVGIVWLLHFAEIGRASCRDRLSICGGALFVDSATR